MKTESISIIITAYNTEKYIEEALDSVSNQTWFKHNDEWEILLGIDHCEKTLEKVKSIMDKYKNLRVFYMKENVGTYITSNTLISKAKYAKILRFDSDDIMNEYMVERMLDAMNTVNKCKLVQCYYKNFPKQEGKRGIDKAHGVFLCKKSVFTKYGAFMPWKCGADTEFLTRIDKNDVYPIAFPQVLFLRRIHDESLTRNKETDMKSKLRKEYKKYIDEQSPNTPIIKTITAPAIEIFKDTVISIPEETVSVEPVKVEAEPAAKNNIVEIKEIPTPHIPKYVKKTSAVIRKRVSANQYTGV